MHKRKNTIICGKKTVNACNRATNKINLKLEKTLLKPARENESILISNTEHLSLASFKGKANFVPNTYGFYMVSHVLSLLDDVVSFLRA